MAETVAIERCLRCGEPLSKHNLFDQGQCPQQPHNTPAAKPLDADVLNADIQKVISDLASDHHYCCPHRPGAGMGDHNGTFCTACVEEACRRVVAKRGKEG